MMLRFMLLLWTVSLVSPAVYYDVEPEERQVRGMDTDYPIEEYLENCGKTHHVGKNTIKFITPFYETKQYPGGISCSWNFIGDEKCFPHLSCTSLDLRKLDNDCSEEYLKVSDGLGGEKVFCGNRKMEKPIRASSGGRDLFVSLQIAADDKFPTKTEGVYCHVKCGKDGEPLEVTQPKKEEFGCVCGLQNKDDRIVGGEDAGVNEFPWQVAIVHAGLRAPKCGGSIINNQWILTAAHCWHFDKTKAKDIDVLWHARVLDQTLKANWADKKLGEKGSIQGAGYGMKAQTDDEEGSQRFKGSLYGVVQIINHPLFTTKYDYDVSLLKLDRKIDLAAANAPTPICLPPLGHNQTFEDQIATVSGWGLSHQDAGGTTRLLQKLEVPIIPTQKCQKWMPYTLTPRMLCAGYEQGAKDACSGDSGGPLGLKMPNKQWHQIGIVSWGEGCANFHRPGLYSRVTELTQWIQHHTMEAKWCRTTK